MSPLIDINQKKSLWDVQWIKREREREIESDVYLSVIERPEQYL